METVPHPPFDTIRTPYTMTDAASAESALQEAVSVLQRGGVIVCATDTGYLLGVDGLNPAAIRKIYAIKGRTFDKPIHLVVANLAMARTVGQFSPTAERLFEHLMPGPLTLIVPKQPVVPDLLVSGLPGVGIRMPENRFLLRLVQAAGLPVTATSANRSGQATPYSVADVETELGAAIEQVDLVLDQGRTPHSRPSTIVDLTQQPAAILREGPLAAETIFALL